MARERSGVVDCAPHPGYGRSSTRLIPDWAGGSTEYLPVLVGGGWWQLVPIWEPDQTPNPLRRWAPPVPRWSAEPWQGSDPPGSR